jgi:hypothetical protein
MSVHDASHAVLAERLLVLDLGRVVADEPPQDAAHVAQLLRRAATRLPAVQNVEVVP